MNDRMARRIDGEADHLAFSLIRDRAKLRELFVVSGDALPCETRLPAGMWDTGGPLDVLLFDCLADACTGRRDSYARLRDIGERLAEVLAKRPDIQRQAKDAVLNAMAAQ